MSGPRRRRTGRPPGCGRRPGPPTRRSGRWSAWPGPTAPPRGSRPRRCVRTHGPVAAPAAPPPRGRPAAPPTSRTVRGCRSARVAAGPAVPSPGPRARTPRRRPPRSPVRRGWGHRPAGDRRRGPRRCRRNPRPRSPAPPTPPGTSSRRHRRRPSPDRDPVRRCSRWANRWPACRRRGPPPARPAPGSRAPRTPGRGTRAAPTVPARHLRRLRPPAAPDPPGPGRRPPRAAAAGRRRRATRPIHARRRRTGRGASWRRPA